MHELAAQSHRTRPPWARPAARFAACLAAALLIQLLPAALGDRNPAVAQLVSLQQSGPDGEAWAAVDPKAVRFSERRGRLRAEFDIDPAAAGQPLGLYLSGAFSASAAWNGAPLGAKGRPGASRAGENPGPVDAVIALPSSLVLPGTNVLILDVSTQHLRRPARSVIHGSDALFGLRVAPYSANERRPLAYYAAPFAVAVALMAALLSMMPQRGRSAGGRWAVATTAALLAAALCELARSAVNYPYPWHELRMLCLLAALWTAGSALILYAASQATPPIGRWRMAFAAAAPGAAFLLPLGGALERLILISAVIAAGIMLWGGARRGGGKPVAWLELHATLLVIVVFLLAWPGMFLDRGLYAASIPLIGYMLFAAPRGPDAAAVARAQAQIPAHVPLVVKTGRMQHILPPEQVRAVHAAGDYSEIELQDGRRVLDERSLAALETMLPETFLRVHRSHIVNVACVTAIQSLGGGRHKATLDGSDAVPVSRNRIGLLRACFKDGANGQ